MDLFSHIFWTWALFKTIKEKINKPINLKLAVFWGIFPDLFAFTIPISLIILDIISGRANLSDFPRPENIEPARSDTVIIFRLLSVLYSMSHSFVIFAAVLISALAFKYATASLQKAKQNLRIPWEISAWALHILIDIPTHSTQFYSTPFLWPVSDVKVNGISWGTPWFLALNYLIILLIYILFLRNKRT